MDSYQKRRLGMAKTIRFVRKIHRLTGLSLFIFFFIIGITGLLLGWKKHSNDYLLASTAKGSSVDLAEWLEIDILYNTANEVYKNEINSRVPEVDRIDIRKNKGTAKFIYAETFWGIQLDGKTGALLKIERRRSDFLEKIHDGSILDLLFGVKSEIIKVVYTTIMGLALITFTITGFWLWYGPRRMKNI